jgi:hypothetical protein
LQCNATFTVVQGNFEQLQRLHLELSGLLSKAIPSLKLSDHLSFAAPLSFAYSKSYNGYGDHDPKRETPFYGISTGKSAVFDHSKMDATENEATKPKRGRKKKDPNAPKRPMTVFFLFYQEAKEIITKELEEQEGKKPTRKVAMAEAANRFKALPAEEREVCCHYLAAIHRCQAKNFPSLTRDGTKSTRKNLTNISGR